VSSSSAAAAARCDRRQVFSFLAGAGFATAFALQSPDTAWAQVDACPPKSQNCIRTTWTPPAGTSPSKAFASIKSVIESYPQQGQANVDLGGWKIVEDDGKSTLRAEFTSGIGTFAKFFNGGKPFVDDLRVQVDGDGAVQIRSNSRVGESDLGVNQKRLVYLADAIAKQGWTIPKVKY
jgi:uncharacterized protein (DUF1499 family)